MILSIEPIKDRKGNHMVNLEFDKQRTMDRRKEKRDAVNNGSYACKCFVN